MDENSTRNSGKRREDGLPANGDDAAPASAGKPAEPARPKEIGGRNGPDPVRYGDWEKNGRCIDF